MRSQSSSGSADLCWGNAVLLPKHHICVIMLQQHLVESCNHDLTIVHMVVSIFRKFLEPDGNLEHPKNVISSTTVHLCSLLKILSKSITNFTSYAAKSRTDSHNFLPWQRLDKSTALQKESNYHQWAVDHEHPKRTKRSKFCQHPLCLLLGIKSIQSLLQTSGQTLIAYNSEQSLSCHDAFCWWWDRSLWGWQFHDPPGSNYSNTTALTSAAEAIGWSRDG